MKPNVLVFYGSYRPDRLGIRLANYVVKHLRTQGAESELIDAKAVGLPILECMYKEYPAGQAPSAMEELAAKIRAADAFVFVTGEYNHGVQPGLKNLTDHFLEEWFWRPVGIASYSAGRSAGISSAFAWHPVLSEMGMVVISSVVSVGPIEAALDENGQTIGDSGKALDDRFPRFAQDLFWWAEAAKNQHALKQPPY